MIAMTLPITAGDKTAFGAMGFPESRTEPVPVSIGTEERSREPESPDLAALAEEVHQKIERINRVDLQFSVDEGSGQIVVTVMDGTTGEVIREIPPSEMLNLAARLDEMIGLVFHQVG